MAKLRRMFRLCIKCKDEITRQDWKIIVCKKKAYEEWKEFIAFPEEWKDLITRECQSPELVFGESLQQFQRISGLWEGPEGPVAPKGPERVLSNE